MLPKGLYEALPWLYMATGALLTALLESDLKFLPALLFFVAGAMVLLYRQTARHGARRPVRASPVRPRSH